jgi:DNA-binding CsgD family transcriptional regulator
MLLSTMLFKLRYADLNGALASSIFLQGFAQQHDLIHLPYVRENLYLSGQVLYLLDRIPEARQVMENFLKLPVHSENQVDSSYIARLHLQLCAAAEAPDPAVPLHNIDAVEDAASWAHVLELEFSTSHGLVAWPRILRDHRAGRPESCRQTTESLRVGITELDDRTQNAIRLAVLAGAVLSNDDSPQLDAQLEHFRAHLEATHFPLLALQTNLLQVVHAHRRGDAHTAVEQLRTLRPAIERCGARRLLLDFPELQHLVHDDLPESDSQMRAASPADFNLTRQEIRILNQLADDLNTKEIAVAHGLSKKTIYGHIHRIFKKLRVHSRGEAVRVWNRE